MADPTAQQILKSDPANANKGTVRGLGMVERSLQSYGAGRSILASNDGVILAGNKTYDRAIELGIPVQEIESDGTTLYVIRRTDLDYDDPRAKELAIADNRASETGLEWDADVLTALADDGIDLTQFWFEDELADVLTATDDDGLTEGIADDKYTTKAETPLYEPTGENPSIGDLTDTTRRDSLIGAIQVATIPDDIRHFLVMAAQRHIVFDYRRIAEFYAHADSDVQRLMEDSALVIIDINRAIELGYAKMRASLIEMAGDDDEG